jgi:enediyne core biosynthesis thioesterase
MFLLEHAPDMLDRLGSDLELITMCSGFDYLAGVRAFDEVSVRMRTEELGPATIGFTYDHMRIRAGTERLAVRGRQKATCVEAAGVTRMPGHVPDELRLALAHYVSSEARRRCSVQLGIGGRA